MNYRGSHHLAAVALVFALLLAGRANAQRPATSELQGYPHFVENYSPDDYEAHHQNWAVVQDKRGLIYAGNNQGVLEFDGSAWDLIPTANQSTVRSLAVDSSGRVYVGAVGEIGYLAPDSSGRMGYVSLRDDLPVQHRDFGKDVWGAHATSHGVYFQTHDHLFRWHEGTFDVWSFEKPLHTSFVVQDDLYVRQTHAGLLRLEEDSLEAVPGGERFSDVSIYALMGYRNGEVLAATRSQGLYLVGPTGVSPIESSGSRYGREHLVYHGARVSDSVYVLATVHGGVAKLNKDLETEWTLDGRTGLLSDRIYHVYPDRSGGVWLASYDGVSRIQIETRFERFDDRNGISSPVQSVAEGDAGLFVGTMEGLVRTHDDSSASPTSFSPVESLDSGQYWDIISTEEELIVTGSNGIHVIDPTGHVTQVGPSLIGFDLRQLRSRPDRVVVADQYQLGCLSHQAGRWRWKGHIPSVEMPVRSMSEDSDGALWLGSTTQGLARIRRPICDTSQVRIRRLSGGARLPSTPMYSVQTGESPLFVARNGEVMAVNRSISGDSAGVTRIGTVGARYTRDGDGPVWAVPGRGLTAWLGFGGEVARIRLDTAGTYSFQRDLEFFLENTEALTVYPDRRFLWIGTDRGLIRLRRNSKTRYDHRDPRVLVRRVQTNGDSVVFGGTYGEFAGVPRASQQAESQAQLAFSENNLRFAYSATAYRNPSATQYQYRLHGFNSEWSDWTNQTFREYTNLHEGDYRFEVRARTVTGTITEAASYGFVVAPPWYRTWGAYVLYGIFGAGALVLYGHFRSLKSRRKLEQERMVTERLAEANEELRKANQMKDEFLANISHELRTPLTSILGFADILAEEVDDSQAEFLKLIKESGSRLHDTLDAILDLAKFRAGMVELDLSPVDVGQEISDAAHLFHPQADEKGLDFTVDVSEEPIMAEIDEFCLERIVNNLLSNAIKFTDEGSVTVVVTACEDEIVLAVRDTGVGVEEEFQPLLFDEFRQESVGDDREHAGVGLGLAITKRMVDLLGGSIQVESEKGVGTTFTVRFPREADARREPEAVTREFDRTNGRSNGHDANGATNADRPIYQVERETHIRFS